MSESVVDVVGDDDDVAVVAVAVVAIDVIERMSSICYSKVACSANRTIDILTKNWSTGRTTVADDVAAAAVAAVAVEKRDARRVDDDAAAAGVGEENVVASKQR